MALTTAGKLYVPLRDIELRPKRTETQLREMQKATRENVPLLKPLDIVQPQVFLLVWV